ncbi:ACP S-malonyltransferase [Streptomyces sp. NPDC048483]|uniref:ACP S-malonyltransferase n=1 Tax=Streptomyces sp. NPDC048483 TaxID=3154927 RepID=UPI003422E7CC
MSLEPLGLLFPGQGTQRQAMGEPWRAVESWSLVDDLSEWTGEDVADLLLHADNEALRRTDLAQIAVFAVAMMAHREAERRGELTGVVACAGHSLGEYAALVAAAALTVRDAAVLVAARGRAMREAAQLREGTMGVLVGAALPQVEAAVRELTETAAAGSGEGELWVANVNAPGQVVLSGAPEAIDRAAEHAPGIGAKLIRVPVGGAFHSPFMQPAAAQLAKALEDVAFAPGHLPVVANVDAAPHDTGADWPELATRQLTSAVRWEESVRTLGERFGCRRFLEVGPGTTLAGMVRRILPGAEVATVAPTAVGQGAGA